MILSSFREAHAEVTESVKYSNIPRLFRLSGMDLPDFLDGSGRCEDYATAVKRRVDGVQIFGTRGGKEHYSPVLTDDQGVPQYVSEPTFWLDEIIDLQAVRKRDLKIQSKAFPNSLLTVSIKGDILLFEWSNQGNNFLSYRLDLSQPLNALPHDDLIRNDISKEQQLLLVVRKSCGNGHVKFTRNTRSGNHRLFVSGQEVDQDQGLELICKELGVAQDEFLYGMRYSHEAKIRATSAHHPVPRSAVGLYSWYV